jgi:signal transduction histidine kinase/ketosteroid isomerase-like protein
MRENPSASGNGSGRPRGTVVREDPAALLARYHRAFNDRDFAVCRDVFDENVELVVDGVPFRGVDAVVGYLVGSVTKFPGLTIASERIVAATDDMVVGEIDLVNGDRASGQSRRQGTACEICRVREGRIVSARSYYMAEPGGQEDAVRVPLRAEAAVFAEERAALRRVATLVARGISQDQLFAAVTEEIGWLVAADATSLLRFESDDTARLVAAWSAQPADLPVGSTSPVDDVLRWMRETGRPWRRAAADLPPAGTFAEQARVLGLRTFVGVPVVVDGRVWGAAFAASVTEESFAEGAEARIAGFAELVATAISDAQARTELHSFAEEQAALQRVATLVAHGAPSEQLLAAAAREVGRLLDVDFTVLSRYEPPGAQVSVGAWSAKGGDVPFPVGTRVEIGARTVVSLVIRTGRAARIDDYADTSGPTADAARRYGLRSAVGVPIEVQDRLWGVMAAASGHEQPLPANTEERLVRFSELVGIAIADARARLQLRRFADEQAALRRVATLVAGAAPAEEVFTAVAEEAGRLLRVDYTVLSRYDPDGLATIVGAWARADPGRPVATGLRLEPEGDNMHALVFRTHRAARIDDYADASGAFADVARSWAYRASVGVPIDVEGRLWGVMIAGSRVEPLPRGTEERLSGFTQLVATAIANAEARAAVAASRARIVAAGDTARRDIGRNLHDGAQQRLVALAMQLRSLRASVPPETETLTAVLDEVAAGMIGVLDELREIARGLHPAVLARGGLSPALKTLARRSPVPVRLDVAVEGRLPEPVELAAYYAVAEALTNAAKHADATVVDISVATGDGLLRMELRDDGRGGADPTAGGSGLVGLTDRVEALGGRLSVRSPAGAGTTLEVVLPLTPAMEPSSGS